MPIESCYSETRQGICHVSDFPRDLTSDIISRLIPSRLSFAGLFSRPRPCPLLDLRLFPQLVHLIQFGHVQVTPLAPLVLRYVLQPRRHQHGGRVPVREGPDDPRPPPGLVVDALDFIIHPYPAPALERELRAGQRLGEPVVRRPRGHSEPHRLQLVLHLLGLPAACLARFLRGIAFNIRATAFRLVTGTLPCMLR